MADDDYVTVTYSKPEAVAAGSAMKSVLQAAMEAGAIPPQPLASAAYKLARAEVEQRNIEGVDLDKIEASVIGHLARGQRPPRAPVALDLEPGFGMHEENADAI